MLNKSLKIVSIFIVSFSLYSCATYLYKQNKELELYKTTFNDFNNTNSPKHEINNLVITSDSNKYTLVESSVNHAAGQMTYIYAFRNDTLIYFGYPYQFSQSSDKTINELGRKYSEIINRKK